MSHNEGLRTRSLASVNAGEYVEIRRILFDSLRHLCSDLGINQGQRVFCHASMESTLLLQNPEGRKVTLERAWARFIQVTPAAAAEQTPVAASSSPLPV